MRESLFSYSARFFLPQEEIFPSTDRQQQHSEDLHYPHAVQRANLDDQRTVGPGASSEKEQQRLLNLAAAAAVDKRERNDLLCRSKLM